MAVPAEILAVERPKNTKVKKSGERYLVIKRTCKRVGGRNLPVDLGTIGEIVDGKYVAKRAEPRRKEIDVKDFGEIELCDRCAGNLLQELADVWDLGDAKRLYVIALLRAAYGNVRNRDLQLQYQTSFVSEKIPGVALSENAVSAFLSSIGEAYSHICEFMRSRVAKYADKNIIIDGMLKDYNSVTGSLSEFSRKALKKGSKDISLMYAYSPQAMEPIAVKAYPGNMLDSTAITDFLTQYKVTSGLMIFDKGFHNDALFEYIDKNKELAALIPLKSDSKLIAKYGMDNPVDVLEGYTEGTVMYKKVKMKNGKWLYAFRDAKSAYEQEVGYVERAEKNKSFSPGDYEQKRKRFGLIVFQSKRNLEPLNVYLAYLGRWEIEVFFDHYKNIVDRDEVNVHTDYRTYATELINFLTVIITMRVKKKLKKTGLSKNYSQKQIFRYLSKYKKVRSDAKGKWESATMLKYISEICSILSI
jgi:hypothetical protein